MGLFPSVWELLIPNFTILTISGILLMILGIIGLIFTIKSKIMRGKFTIGIPIKIFSFLIFVGVIMVWGISIVQDFLSTQGGSMIFWGTIIVFVLGFILFWNPKSGNNGNSKRKLNF